MCEFVCLCILAGGSEFGFGSASVYVLPTHRGSGLNQNREIKGSKKKKRKVK